VGRLFLIKLFQLSGRAAVPGGPRQRRFSGASAAQQMMDPTHPSDSVYRADDAASRLYGDPSFCLRGNVNDVHAFAH
jgi:hypothetical protein